MEGGQEPEVYPPVIIPPLEVARPALLLRDLERHLPSRPERSNRARRPVPIFLSATLPFQSIAQLPHLDTRLSPVLFRMILSGCLDHGRPRMLYHIRLTLQLTRPMVRWIPDMVTMCAETSPAFLMFPIEPRVDLLLRTTAARQNLRAPSVPLRSLRAKTPAAKTTMRVRMMEEMV